MNIMIKVLILDFKACIILMCRFIFIQETPKDAEDQASGLGRKQHRRFQRHRNAEKYTN